MAIAGIKPPVSETELTGYGPSGFGVIYAADNNALGHARVETAAELLRDELSVLRIDAVPNPSAILACQPFGKGLGLEFTQIRRIKMLS